VSDPIPVPVLETPRLRLRLWEEADADALHPVFGDAETMQFWAFTPRRDVAETAAMIRDSRAAQPLVHAAFAITLRDSGEPIGMVNYHEHHMVHGRMAVGWILHRSWQRRGIMREAVPAFLAHCFDGLNAHRIEARIEAENLPSVALADWLGFQREGRMRDWMFVGGQARSPHMHALLRPDWNARRDQVSSTSSP
jgi:[ribosomal protein S5]-alanine N-acetyltransferase